jgi:ATP-dependent Clp protease ATP-binding subunit ClpB
MLDQLGHRLAERQLRLQVTDAARRYIATAGFDPVYGARPLRRYLQREIETRIGRALLAGDVPDGATITLDKVDDELSVTWSQPTGHPTEETVPAGA